METVIIKKLNEKEVILGSKKITALKISTSLGDVFFVTNVERSLNNKELELNLINNQIIKLNTDFIYTKEQVTIVIVNVDRTAVFEHDEKDPPRIETRYYYVPSNMDYKIKKDKATISVSKFYIHEEIKELI